MAAPTNVRVESNSLRTTTIRWSYSGAAEIAVFRSTDGISYSEITLPTTRVAVGTLLYIDSSLEPGTKYWYKLSDDNGSTFSSVVTVVTQSCLPPAGSLDTLSLPRAEALDAQTDENGDTIIIDKFNNLSERIENVLGGRLLAPDECIVCPQDGAVILNCAGHCRQWTVIADEDINSISMQYCDEGEGNIDFVIPPNVTRRITGFPDGFGGTDLPFVVSGANGRTMSVPVSATGGKAMPTSSRPGTSRGIGSGGGTAGSGGCSCSPVGGLLTIKSCNANNSLDCQSTKKLQLVACGGRLPYTWTKTGNITLSATSGNSIIVRPPTNAGSAVVGNAYAKTGFSCSVVGTGCQCFGAGQVLPVKTVIWGCNDQQLDCDDTSPATNCPTPPAPTNNFCQNAVGCQLCSFPACSAPGMGNLTVVECDLRSAGMISAGCEPCGVQAGATVTVTDALGVQVTVILRQ